MSRSSGISARAAPQHHPQQQAHSVQGTQHHQHQPDEAAPLPAQGPVQQQQLQAQLPPPPSAQPPAGSMQPKRGSGRAAQEDINEEEVVEER